MSVYDQKNLKDQRDQQNQVLTEALSEAFYERAKKLIPGGVNSPVRAFLNVGGKPIFISKAWGAYMYSANNLKYIDYIGSWGPMILGHAYPKVVKAISDAASLGTSFGAPTELEVLFAEKIRDFYPSIEMMRAVSSGTEATMSALRVARGFTGRDLVVKFEGCYHGHADFLLVKAGSGAATFGTPDSLGVPAPMAENTLTLPFNDVEKLRKLFSDKGASIAAVIVEPVAGNMGVVLPQPGFLEEILSLSKTYGAVSVFDEVMTGCRVHESGMQGKMGLRPDMTCLGKIVGGGLPLAVYGGRRDIMACVSPLGPVYQAGTLSGNPVAVSAALALLSDLTPAVYTKLESLSLQLQVGLERSLAEANRDRRDRGRDPILACVQRMGSMLTLFFQQGPVSNWAQAKQSDVKAYSAFHEQLLRRKIYFPPSQFEALFVSFAHSSEDIEETCLMAKEAFCAMP